jgi:hypothetical protein
MTKGLPPLRVSVSRLQLHDQPDGSMLLEVEALNYRPTLVHVPRHVYADLEFAMLQKHEGCGQRRQKRC